MHSERFRKGRGNVPAMRAYPEPLRGAGMTRTGEGRSALAGHVFQDVDADGAGEVFGLAGGAAAAAVDLLDQLVERDAAAGGDGRQLVPEGVLDRQAGAMAGDPDRVVASLVRRVGVSAATSALPAAGRVVLVCHRNSPINAGVFS